MRRPGHAVRHHDQPLAHRGQHRAHQRLEPVLRVHAPRQLGVQPREHQPPEVPRRRRHLRRPRVRAHRRGDVHRAGDPGRQRRLSHREDRRDHAQVPPARPRIRQPRRVAHGAGHGVRLRRRSRMGRRDHRAHDRACLCHERAHRRPDGPVRRVRGQCRADARRPSDASSRGCEGRRGARAAGAARRRAARVGRCRRARRDLGCTELAGDGARTDRHDRAHDGLRHHRGGARPRAHEGEEARRRRHDAHRQPDDPSRPAQARVLRRAGRRHRRVHRRAQEPARSARRSTPSTCRCSRARWATTPSTTWVTSR